MELLPPTTGVSLKLFLWNPDAPVQRMIKGQEEGL